MTGPGKEGTGNLMQAWNGNTPRAGLANSYWTVARLPREECLNPLRHNIAFEWARVSQGSPLTGIGSVLSKLRDLMPTY